MNKVLTYISHPSSGLDINRYKVEDIIRLLYNNDECYNKLCVVSPIHNYGFMYDEMEYFKGLSLCTDLLAKCNIMLVFGNHKESVGCTEEIKFCEEHRIPYIIIKNRVELEKLINNGSLIESIENKLLS